MPSEREIRKLYVNGRTICIEFFFCLLKIFSAFAGRAAATEGSNLGSLYSLTLTYPCFIYSFTDYAAKLKYFVTENPSDFLLSKAMNILL